MGQVADLEYVVEGDEDHWALWWQGQCCGRFPSCRAALEVAEREAERVRLLGHSVRIVVRAAEADPQPPSRPSANQTAFVTDPALLPLRPVRTWRRRSPRRPKGGTCGHGPPSRSGKVPRPPAAHRRRPRFALP